MPPRLRVRPRSTQVQKAEKIEPWMKNMVLRLAPFRVGMAISGRGTIDTVTKERLREFCRKFRRKRAECFHKSLAGRPEDP